MNFLNERNSINYTITKPSDFLNIKKYMFDDFELINAYYKHREGVVNNKNLFVKLIKNTMEDLTLDIFEYLNLIEIDYIYKTKTLNMTSSINQGKVFTNVLGETTTILIDKFISPFEAYDNLDLPVAKVLYSDFTDLSMNHPTKINTNNFIILVDVVALLMQYKKWSEIRIENDLAVTPQVFVYQVFYTNLIREILDWSILNRFFNTVTPKSVSKHPFGVRNYDNDINKMLEDISKRLRSTNRFYEEVLYFLPSLFYENMYEKLKVYRYNVNANNYWVYFITNANLLNKLINFLGTEGIKKNNGLIVDYKYLLRDVKNNNYIRYIDFKTISFTDIVFGLFDEGLLLTGETK